MWALYHIFNCFHGQSAQKTEPCVHTKTQMKRNPRSAGAHLRSQGQPGLQSNFQDSQHYTEKPCLRRRGGKVRRRNSKTLQQLSKQHPSTQFTSPCLFINTKEQKTPTGYEAATMCEHNMISEVVFDRIFKLASDRKHSIVVVSGRYCGRNTGQKQFSNILCVYFRI